MQSACRAAPLYLYTFTQPLHHLLCTTSAHAQQPLHHLLCISAPSTQHHLLCTTSAPLHPPFCTSCTITFTTTSVDASTPLLKLCTYSSAPRTTSSAPALNLHNLLTHHLLLNLCTYTASLHRLSTISASPHSSLCITFAPHSAPNSTPLQLCTYPAPLHLHLRLHLCIISSAPPHHLCMHFAPLHLFSSAPLHHLLCTTHH